MTRTQKERSARAKETFVRVTAQMKKIAIENEIKLSKAISGKHLKDPHPFDVFLQKKEKHFIEVKTILKGKNDKITVHPNCMKSKLKVAKKQKANIHTFVFDDRTGKFFYKEGVGSFRLSTMTPVATMRSVVKWLH